MLQQMAVGSQRIRFAEVYYCVFRENTAIKYFNADEYGLGAAVYNYMGSSPTFTNCTFYNNTDQNQGAIMFSEITPTMPLTRS